MNYLWHMEWMFLIIGLLAGGVATYVFMRKQAVSKDETLMQTKQQAAMLQMQYEHMLHEKQTATQYNQDLQQSLTDMTAKFASKETAYILLQEQLQVQTKDLEKMQERLKTEFENLANRILEEKSQKFTDQNRQSLDNVLLPFKERIKEFEAKVQKAYETESTERNSLKGEIKQLMQLNQHMHAEAQNLTRALKGDNKTQGNWGEFILESILEKSGLVKDREYKTQESSISEDGRRLQPDVIITLPEGKQLIIDSKVSLVAFEKAVNADDETRSVFIKEHIQSVRNHMKQLSDKKYQQLYGIQSLDFVLLFIPVEPAFAMAVQYDNQLFHDAFERNIVIVSPTTLLATLRTVANIWRNENQSRNAFEIARKAGDLYDKFVGFSEEMIELGKQMDRAKQTYEESMKKLSTGKGNVVKRLEELKTMGAGASKSINSSLKNRALEDSDE